MQKIPTVKPNEAAKLLNPDLLNLPLIPNEPMPTFTFPFFPSGIGRDALYEFNLNHVMAINKPIAV